MAVTTPDNLYSPDDDSAYALVQDLGLAQDSVQAALIKRANLYVGTSAQRTAFTSAAEGTHWQDTDGQKRVYIFKAGKWTQGPYTTEDTQWANITLNVGTGSARWRRYLGRVELEVAVKYTTAVAAGAMATAPVTLPASARPSKTTPLIGAASTGSQPAVSMAFVSGTVSLRNASNYAHDEFFISGYWE